MVVIHKCDACKKSITGDRTVVDIANYHFDRFELCQTCAAPILALLKKYKLIA